MQEFIVAMVVAYAAWSVAARYAPKAFKRAVRKLAARAMRDIGLYKAADYVGREAQGADCASGCGSCGGCGPAAGPAPKQSAITPEALRRTARAGR